MNNTSLLIINMSLIFLVCNNGVKLYLLKCCFINKKEDTVVNVKTIYWQVKQFIYHLQFIKSPVFSTYVVSKNVLTDAGSNALFKRNNLFLSNNTDLVSIYIQW